MGRGDRPHPTIAVAVQGLLSTVDEKYGRIKPVEVIDEHLLMIAAQKDCCRKGRGKSYQVIDHPGAGRSAIDIIAKEHDPVGRIRLDPFHELG